MGWFRARATVPTLLTLIVGAAVLAARAQTIERHVILENVGLAAIDEGLIGDETHAPGTREALRRAATRLALHRQSTQPAARYAVGRVLVKFREAISAAERLAAVQRLSRSATIEPRRSYADFDVVHIGDGENPETVAAALGNRADVEYAQAAYSGWHTLMVPNDPLYATRQWNLPMINLERAWDLQPQAGSSIVVAVLDTGVAFQNATLVENIPAFLDEAGVRYPALGRVTIPYSGAPQLMAPGRFVAPFDFIWDNAVPLDFDGHGTHVAGTIGQLTNDNIGTAGVAFNVRIMPVKVLDSVWDFLFGSPNIATDDVVARGIRYAADNGADIINMSIGRTGPPNTAPVVEAAITYAISKGVFVAIAGGNEFEVGNPLEVIAEIASRVDGAVSVAAVDRNKAHAYYSSTGSYIELSAPGGSERGFPGPTGYIFQQTFDFAFTDTFLLPPAEFTAPRFDIMANIGYIGTSMATPHVSGLAAMMKQQGFTNPAAIEAAMKQTAVDLGAAGRDDTFGHGLIDARAALRGFGVAR
jgi:serine protease